MDQSDVCGFCKRGLEVENICGRLHSERVGNQRVTAHHKCMQYSAQLVQYKFEHFGGFKISKVQAELRRGLKVHCHVCKTKRGSWLTSGATAGCAVSQCRKTFHFYCAETCPQMITKRLKVQSKEREMVLYRVFCSKKHEDHYRASLKKKMNLHQEINNDSDSDISDENEEEDRDNRSDNTSEGELDDDWKDFDVTIKSIDSSSSFHEKYNEYDHGRTRNKSSVPKNSKDAKEGCADSQNSGQHGPTGATNGLMMSDITEDFNTSTDALSDSGSNVSETILLASSSMSNSECVSQHQNFSQPLKIGKQYQILSYMKMPPKVISTAKKGEETLEGVQIILPDPVLMEEEKTQGDIITDSTNMVPEPDINQESFGYNPESVNRDKFLVVIVPEVQYSTELRQKIHRWANSEFNITSSEYVTVWQDMFCPVGLNEHHLPHIMYDVCDKISKNDTNGLSQILFNCDLDKYSHTIQISDMIKGQDFNVIESTIFSFINEVLKDTNSKAKSKIVSLLSLPSSSALGLYMDDYIDQTYQVRSKLHKPLYQWTSKTRVVPGTGKIGYRPNLEFERYTVMTELHGLLYGRFELQTRPVEDVFCVRVPDSFMDKMKQKLQELFAVPMAEANTLQPSQKQIVLCITGVNRELVKYRAYVNKVTEEFLSKYVGKGMELFCIFSIGESNEFASYQDVVPAKFHGDKNLTVFTAFCPELVPVECVVLRYKKQEVPEKESLLKRQKESLGQNMKRNLKQQEKEAGEKNCHLSLRRARIKEHPENKTLAEHPGKRFQYAEDNEKPSTSGWKSQRKMKRRMLEKVS